MNITDEAAEAALEVFWDTVHMSSMEAMRAALEAAALNMMASAIAYLDESVRRIAFDPDVKDYERGFDDATRGMAAKVKRLLNGEEQ